MPSDLRNMLKLDKVMVYKYNELKDAPIYRMYQIKICILLLLYLTGCRVSELDLIFFKNIETILTSNVLTLWVSKDKNQEQFT